MSALNLETPAICDTALALEQLQQFLQQYPSVMVLTGAGISTDSGIPDYRDQNGQWKRKQPVQHQDFMRSHTVRQRYWARSLIGWRLMQNAKPNAAHFALAQLQQQQDIRGIITQNVDGLHQAAGSHHVTDLHGRADQVLCMSCGWRCSRDETHAMSAELNPEFLSLTATAAPDGDADLETDFSLFQVADCPHCGGILKPDVVFFGDNVPKERVHSALEMLQQADALWVIGSSLMVYSGFRFCKYAQQWQKPIMALTLGKTRADAMLDLRLNVPIAPVLTGLVQTA